MRWRPPKGPEQESLPGGGTREGGHELDFCPGPVLNGDFEYGISRLRDLSAELGLSVALAPTLPRMD